MDLNTLRNVSSKFNMQNMKVTMVGDLKTPSWFENPYEIDRFLNGIWKI